ncbi:unnamed protein product [Spodoptera exigua]|nr:unnamed protein product [Spodoptera exigua]
MKAYHKITSVFEVFRLIKSQRNRRDFEKIVKDVQCLRR